MEEGTYLDYEMIRKLIMVEKTVVELRSDDKYQLKEIFKGQIQDIILEMIMLGSTMITKGANKWNEDLKRFEKVGKERESDDNDDGEESK